MDIPQPNTLAKIEHRGAVVQCIVDSVLPDSESPLYFWVWLQVLPEREYREREQCAWVTDSGQRIPAILREVVSNGEVTMIRLRAIADAPPT